MRLAATIGQKVKKEKYLIAIEAWYGFVIAILLAYFSTDIGLLYLRDKMLPNASSQSKPKPLSFVTTLPHDHYNTIISRNIFNWSGVIPDALVPVGEKPKEEVPVLSQLPLALIGTIVHSNPAKSIASIELKSKNQTLSFSMDRDIENIAKVVRVERGKVIFRNLNNGRLEFIEIKNLNKTNIGLASSSGSEGPAEIKQVERNKFEIKKSELQKHLNNLPALLQDASTQPRKNPATGAIECFIITGMKEKSVYSQLGLQRGDCLKSVNGQPIDSPQRAMEMYQKLRNADSVSLTFERDGSDTTSNYSIK